MNQLKCMAFVIALLFAGTALAGAIDALPQLQTDPGIAPTGSPDVKSLPAASSADASLDADHEADDLVTALTIFVLAIYVGFEIITKVPPTLHTPLMSGSNAVSGITAVGALVCVGARFQYLTSLLAFLAVTFATINVVGGFLVTHRMLGMFKRR